MPLNEYERDSGLIPGLAINKLYDSQIFILSLDLHTHPLNST